MTGLPPGLRYPWDAEPVAPPDPVAALPSSPSKPRGRRPAVAGNTPASADWLYHHLTVSGSPAAVDDFVAAACGAGIAPWRLDYARIEEDVFNLAVSQPPPARRLTVAGCRRLARQFRERVEARQERAAARLGRSRACPFDLHTLLPIPDAILAMGPADPAALAWLAEHWGIVEAPRHVTALLRPSMGKRLPAGHAVRGWGFFTAKTSPAAAISQIAAAWPALRFRLQVRPD
jgi:hypothetical protein